MDLTSFITVFDYIIRMMTKIFDALLKFAGKGPMFPETTAPETTTAAPEQE